MPYFGILFLVTLFLEIMSIVWMADWLGGGIVLLLMVGSFILGVFMLRRMGASGIFLAASAMRGGGKVSLYQLLWPIRYAVAAVLLMSPGFVSTAAAVILMLPFKGKPVADLGGGVSGRHYAEEEGFAYTRHSGARSGDDIIEGDYTVTDGPEKSASSASDYLDDKTK